MIISHNLSAMNSKRMLNINNKKKASVSEKLGSGYRINRSADDAAGLAISEKMRRQIRGLDKGKDNIEDGISLIQTADGAMNEVVEVLQRINELSVQAYNDTNAEEDRNAIQEEVSQLLEEIDNIADTTTFNNIPLLKGNLVKEIKIENNSVSEWLHTEYVMKEKPEWLEVDAKLEVHSGYTGTQDVTGIMYQTINNKLYYYGPQNSPEAAAKGAEWAGTEWTSNINDNPSAKMSFEELANFENAEELYAGLFDLIGTSIGAPCGTCSEIYYGINYTGSFEDYSATIKEYTSNGTIPAGELNLTEWKAFTNSEGESVNCFDKVMELIVKHQNDKTMSEDDKKLEAKTLADEIAKKLCEKSYEVMTRDSEQKDHFGRAIQSGDYDIIIYDYRDDNQLTDKHAADAKVQTSVFIELTTRMSDLAVGTELEIKSPLMIAGSANAGDSIPIDLPNLSLEVLGVTDYNVANYQVVEEYSEEYAKRLKDWEEDFEYQTITETTTQLKPKGSKHVFENGERKTITEYEKVEVTFETTIKVPRGEKPEPKEGDITIKRSYKPSRNEEIANALNYVLSLRSGLGAKQNRLEHAYNNNYNISENTQAAESRIRDTDMAAAMLEYSTQNILQQAGQAMLAQANQDKQGILSLLQ